MLYVAQRVPYIHIYHIAPVSPRTHDNGETRNQHQERKWSHLGACGDAQAASVALNSRIIEFVLISYG